MEDRKLAAVVPAERMDLWRLWGQIYRLFPTWGLIPSSFVTPGAWGYVGVDFLSGFRRNRSTIRAFELLADVDDATFKALTGLAALNARRQEQILRFVIIAYLTVPLSTLAVIADLAGASVLSFIKAHADFTGGLIATATTAPVGYMMSNWRSRQLVGVLDLIRIERGRSRADGGEDLDGET